MRVSYEIPKSAAVSILLFCIGLYLLMAFPYSEGKLQAFCWYSFR